MVGETYVRHVATGVATAALLLVIGSVAAFSTEPSKVTEDSLLGALQKRRSVLEQLVEIQVQAYQVGEAGFDSVVRAREQFLSAELELATGYDDRIKLLEASVKTTEDFEGLVTAAYHAGKAGQGDVLESQALHLQAQARLMREQLKGK